MCNRYRNKTHGPRDWTEDLRQIKIPLRFPDPAPNWREVYHPTDPAPVFRPIDPNAPLSGLEVATMRWDLIPSFWRKPVKGKFLATNARCETVGALPAFKAAHARRRCLVPADGFFEWSGEKGAKTKWLITSADQPWFCFAGIWDRAETENGPVESVAILTSAPGADMTAIHTRQPVILAREQWGAWLDLNADPRPLYEPAPAGALRIEPADA